MLIRYTSMGFMSAITLQRGSVRSVNGKDIDIVLDTETQMIRLTDKGTENGAQTGSYRHCIGATADVPSANMLMGLNPVRVSEVCAGPTPPPMKKKAAKKKEPKQLPGETLEAFLVRLGTK